MTYYISDEARSSLKDGIETILLPIHNHHDLQDLVFHTQRGGTYDVVEWLLSQLYRSTELERVCGLSVTPQQDGTVIVNLELRQPGLQMEQWVKEHTGPGRGRVLTRPNNGKTVEMDHQVILCERALSEEKFTDTHRPWWESQVPLIPTTLEPEF